MKRMLLVVNPRAGTCKAKKVLFEIIDLFNQAEYDVSVHITQGPDDARNVVCAQAAKLDLVVCCGGDGTFHETVAGILDSGTDVPVGYIPAGSTNDFAGSLKLPTKLLDAAKVIVDGSPEQFDVGSFNGRYFTYIASFGAFTRTSYATSQSMKNTLGHLAYLLGGVKEISQLRHKHHLKMELDGEIVEGDYIFGAICNSTSVGGIITLDPERVDMSDGIFEVMLIQAPKNLLELGECIQSIRKQTYNCRMITFRSAREVKIWSEPDMPWTLDGEKQDGCEDILIKNLQHAFRLVR